MSWSPAAPEEPACDLLLPPLSSRGPRGLCLESLSFSEIDPRALFPGASPQWPGRSPLLPAPGAPPLSSSPWNPHSFLSLNLCSHCLRDPEAQGWGRPRPRCSAPGTFDIRACLCDPGYVTPAGGQAQWRDMHGPLLILTSSARPRSSSRLLEGWT